MPNNLRASFLQSVEVLYGKPCQCTNIHVLTRNPLVYSNIMQFCKPSKGILGRRRTAAWKNSYVGSFPRSAGECCSNTLQKSLSSPYPTEPRRRKTRISRLWSYINLLGVFTCRLMRHSSCSSRVSGWIFRDVRARL